MIINKTDIIKKVRIAIDEIMPESAQTIDTFRDDLDAEIWQAVRIAAEQLSLELPRELLQPVSVEDVTVEGGTVDGDRYVSVDASKYLALYELRMSDWKMSVTSTFMPGGDEEMQQLTKWTRGTVWKPRVMEAVYGDKVRLYYWVSSANTVKRFSYVPRPYFSKSQGATADDQLTTGLQQSAESYIIYRAGRLVMTGKKETALAQEMEAISKLRIAND